MSAPNFLKINTLSIYAMSDTKTSIDENGIENTTVKQDYDIDDEICNLRLEAENEGYEGTNKPYEYIRSYPSLIYAKKEDFQNVIENKDETGIFLKTKLIVTSGYYTSGNLDYLFEVGDNYGAVFDLNDYKDLTSFIKDITDQIESNYYYYLKDYTDLTNDEINKKISDENFFDKIKIIVVGAMTSADSFCKKHCDAVLKLKSIASSGEAEYEKINDNHQK